MNEQQALPPPDPSLEETPDSGNALRRLNPVPILYLAGFVILAGAIFWLWQNPPLEPTQARVDPAEVAALHQQVQTLEDRLTTIEQRPAPTLPPMPAPVDLKPLIARITALEQRPVPGPPPAPPPPVDLGPINQRLAALEQRPVPTPPPPVDLGPINQRLAALEQRPQVPADIATKGDLAPLASRVDSLVSRDDQLANRQQGLETNFTKRADAVDGKIGTLEHEAAGLAALSGAVKATDQRVQVVEQQASQVSALADKAGRIGRIQSAQAALDAGQPLGDVPGAPPPLARFAQTKPPTEAELRLSFPDAARAAEVASQPPTDGKPFLDRIWTRAQDLVTVREGDHVLVGDPASGVIAHARRALMAGDLAGTVTALDGLSGPAAAAMADWKAQASALLDARAALAALAAHA